MKTVAIQEKRSIQLARFVNADLGQVALVISTLHIVILSMANADALFHYHPVLRPTLSVIWRLINVP